MSTDHPGKPRDAAAEQKLHRTIRKVSADTEALQYKPRFRQ